MTEIAHSNVTQEGLRGKNLPQHSWIEIQGDKI